MYIYICVCISHEDKYLCNVNVCIGNFFASTGLFLSIYKYYNISVITIKLFVEEFPSFEQIVASLNHHIIITITPYEMKCQTTARHSKHVRLNSYTCNPRVSIFIYTAVVITFLLHCHQVFDFRMSHHSGQNHCQRITSMKVIDKLWRSERPLPPPFQWARKEKKINAKKRKHRACSAQ